MKIRSVLLLPFALCLLLPCVPLVGAANETLAILPANVSTLAVTDDNGTPLNLNFLIWGPNWEFASWKGTVTEENGAAHHHLTSKLKSGATLTLEATIQLKQGDHLIVKSELSSDADTDVTLVCLGVLLDDKQFTGGRLTTTKADGTKSDLPLPLGKNGPGANVKSLEFTPPSGPAISVAFEQPATVQSDHAARIVLAGGHLAAKVSSTQTVTFILPAKATYFPTMASVPQEPGFDRWYPFRPDAKGEGADELSAASFIDAPAGKKGRITSEGASLKYGGQPIRLWGINVCYGACAPEKALADKQAEFYARHGVNVVRLHKFADGSGWAGIQMPDSFVKLDPAGLDRMDYFISKLKEKGIFVEFSANFGVRPGEADAAAVPYLSEFGSLSGKNARVKTGNGVVFISDELQGLLFAQITGVLEHKNPYTNLTYAEDPAVAVIEAFNEDSALFFGTMGTLKKSPTLRARLSQRFTRWLKARYGSEQGLLAAWGNEALNSFAAEGFTGESFEKESIVPAGNPWFYAPAQLAGLMAPRKQRLLDTMRFLYEVQNEFYGRYRDAVRKAGYTGALVASNWQAGSAFSHFYNLDSDAQFEIVDRHNYFGGVEATMLAKPGSGILGSGMMQVANRPFELSEWINTFPSEYAIEAPAIVSAYGMGLQGWDVSFEFQNRDQATYLPQLGGSEWEVMTPQNFGLFPVVSRQVLRGDIKTADKTATRYVNVIGLEKGELGFDDKATQSGDVKTFNSATVPAESLAVVRSVVEFTKESRKTEPFDLSPYLKNGAYESSTGQLRWHPAAADKRNGWFTINTPATQAVVGFAGGGHYDLADVAVDPVTPFAAIYLTAQDRNATLASGHAVIVTALARTRNTDEKIAGGHLVERGKAPMLLEPVVATLTLKRQGTPTVYLLDHAGHRTGATLPVKDGKVTIDGARDKTPYYLVTW